MTLLRSHRSVWRLAELDNRTGEIRPVALWRSLAWKSRPADGWYGDLGDKRLAVYRADGNLWLRIDDRALPFSRLKLDLAQTGTLTAFRVWSDGHLVAEIEYKSGKPWPPLERDTTANVEEEQFDFGLFLLNIGNDPARQARLLAYQESH